MGAMTKKTARMMWATAMGVIAMVTTEMTEGRKEVIKSLGRLLWKRLHASCRGQGPLGRLAPRRLDDWVGTCREHFLQVGVGNSTKDKIFETDLCPQIRLQAVMLCLGCIWMHLILSYC